MNAPEIRHNPAFTLPRPDQRVSVVGRTGSGKTQLGFWLLSEAPFDRDPWIIVDYKRDRLFAAVDRIKEIGLNDIPDEPGLFVVRPEPGQDEEIERLLTRIKDTENIGLFVDEGYEIPDGRPFRTILSQGRSKNIPAIILSQRPCWVSRSVFSEADHYVVFHLNHRKDQQRVEEFIPEVDLRNRLPKYHSRWYNVELDHIFQLGPVPDAQVLVDRIDKRLQALEPTENRSWF